MIQQILSYPLNQINLSLISPWINNHEKKSWGKWNKEKSNQELKHLNDE